MQIAHTDIPELAWTTATPPVFLMAIIFKVAADGEFGELH
jgi:hypothetical protein